MRARETSHKQLTSINERKNDNKEKKEEMKQTLRKGITSILLLTIATVSGTMVWATNKPTKNEKSQKGYRYTLIIKGCKDTVMYLGNYYAGNTYAIDTAFRNKKGQFVFEKKDKVLLPGLYFFTSPGHDYVEFMVYNEKQDFTFETEESGWTRHMQVKGSKENDIFYTFHRSNYRIYDEIDSMRAAQQEENEAFKAFRKKKMLELDSIKESLITANPNSMLALMMNATRDIYVPKEDSTGEALSDRQRWEYFMNHYFDFVRLDDDAIVRTPDVIFHKRVMDYLDMYLKGAGPEIVCEYVDKMIEKARPSKEAFKYLVHTVAEKYLQSNVMSYDAVYVHMVKKYIETGDAFWMSPTVIDENVKRANTWDKLLIGKPTPPLIMKDTEGNIQSLYGLKNKYTLLIFWSPTCGHCKTMIPELYKAYEKYRDKYDIAAYAVLSEPDDHTRPKWHDFIEKNGLKWINLDGGEANIDWHEVYDVVTTPQIYLLDKDKMILAKRLSATTFEEIIKMIEGEE